VRKSIYSPEYKCLVALLRTTREERGYTQEMVAAALGLSASQLSKWERRERRIDVSEARLYCLAIGVNLVDLIAKWQERITDE
jgi:transcriptional regulator with XRE-family HTH domain